MNSKRYYFPMPAELNLSVEFINILHNYTRQQLTSDTSHWPCADLPSYPHLASFSCNFRMFLHPATFLVYAFLPALCIPSIPSGTCCSFSLKSLFFLKTYYVLNQYSPERRHLQSFPVWGKIAIVLHIQIVSTIKSIMAKNW